MLGTRHHSWSVNSLEYHQRQETMMMIESLFNNQKSLTGEADIRGFIAEVRTQNRRSER